MMLSQRLQIPLHISPLSWTLNDTCSSTYRFQLSHRRICKIILRKIYHEFPESLISISFLWQKMKLPDIQQYLVPVNDVDITHVKPCQNLHVTRRSRLYTIGMGTICYIVSTSGWKNINAGISRCSYPDIVKRTGRRNFYRMHLSYQHQKILSLNTVWYVVNITV